MRKNRKSEFALILTAYFAVCALDLLLTYIATPNLYLEGNPLVDALSFGWGGLIMLNVVTFALFAAMAYYAFIAYKPPHSEETDMRRYLADINYGDPDKTVPFMWKLPKYWAPQTACLCWSVSLALPLSRLIIVFEWLLLVLQVRAPLFFSIVAAFPLGRIDVFVAVILAWILSFVWIRLEYKENLRKLSSEKHPSKAEV